MKAKDLKEASKLLEEWDRLSHGVESLRVLSRSEVNKDGKDTVVHWLCITTPALEGQLSSYIKVEVSPKVFSNLMADVESDIKNLESRLEYLGVSV